jgi:hypothetical protein
MGLTFTTAPTVEAGDRITSEQFSLLARAFNDRIKSGVADGAWRIAYYNVNLFRQVRNPAQGGWVFPTQAEFFDLYQHLAPENDPQITWPVTGPGEYEGANLANPMMQFVFGVAPDLDSEDIRLADDVSWSLGSTPTTLGDWWELGKHQRGGYDPSTGGQVTPAWDAATSFFRISQPYWSPHGKSYGGFFPTPTILSNNCDCASGGGCGSDPDLGAGVPSYQIKFTALRDDVTYGGSYGTASGTPQVVTYPGSCPDWTADSASGHVLAIARYPFAYYVYVNDGAGGVDVEVLRTADWLEGPYTGQGYLAHADGQQLHRAVHAFVSEFCGTSAQRDPDTYRIETLAADFQAFFTSQHQLSPAKGSQVGNEIILDYPSVTFQGPTVDPGFGSWNTGGTGYQIAEDFVLGGIYAKAEKLSAPVTLTVYNGTTAIETLTLTPDADGFAEALATVRNGGEYNVKVGLNSRASFDDGTGYIRVEISELYGYRPQYWDAYLLCRFAATAGGDAFNGGVDGSGVDYTTAKQITDDYLYYGCLVNRSGAEGPRTILEWVTDNPVYQAARRMCREQFRLIRRNNFDSVEVTGGKTVLYFKRYAYGMDRARADMFDGIAPPIDPVASGELEVGETYVVQSTDGTGTIVYDGNWLTNGDTFTVTTETEYQTNGDALVYVYDGIRTAARKKGYSNEWVMFLETKCYHLSPTSIWKPEAYSDYFAFNNRCHFYSATADDEVRRFMAYNHSTELDGDYNPTLNDLQLQAVMVSPEAPTGYNYVDDTNRLYGSADFYSSCRIYEKPYVVESCTVDRFGADAVVKVTLTERLRSHPDAPATVDRTVANWDTTEKDNLGLEDYRTDDNAVREYALWNYDNNENCTQKTGDAGTGSGVFGLADNPWGSCFPTFFFVKLVPEPYEDGNNTQQTTDTRCTVRSFQQMETYLKAMCEGYVDGTTSLDIICDSGTGGLFDYTFENLCFEAFGGTSVGAFSLTDRSDEPAGFGPLPNTKMYADVFNRLSSAVNLLTKARLEVPVTFDYRTVTYPRTYREESFTDTDGSSGCSTSSFYAAIRDSAGPVDAVGSPSYSSWSTWTSVSASKSTIADACPSKLAGDRVDVEYKVSIDTAFANAVPSHIQDLVDNLFTGFVATQTDNQNRDFREAVTAGSGDSCSGTADHWHVGTDYYRWTLDDVITSTDCVIINSGTLVAPALLTADYGVGHAAGSPNGTVCNAGGTSSDRTLDLLTGSIAYVEVPLV